MVKTSDEVLKYYNAPDEYSFFDEGDIVVNMAVPKKYEKRIKVLLEQWAKEDEDTDGYVPQAVPQNDNSYQNSNAKNKPENYQFTFDDMTDNSSSSQNSFTAPKTPSYASKPFGGFEEIIGDDAVPF